MYVESLTPIEPVFELLPEYDFSKVSIETIYQMHQDFQDKDGKSFDLNNMTEAFNYLRRNRSRFQFSSPETLLKKYKFITTSRQFT
jgi:hypothetical protein